MASPGIRTRDAFHSPKATFYHRPRCPQKGRSQEEVKEVSHFSGDAEAETRSPSILVGSCLLT